MGARGGAGLGLGGARGDRAPGATRVKGSGALAAARGLRAALRALAEDLREGQAPAAARVTAINDVLAMGVSVLRIERRSDGYETKRQLLEARPQACSCRLPNRPRG